jgi:hypothetical protein
MNFIFKLLKFKNLTIKVKYDLILIVTKRITKYKYFILYNEVMIALKLTHLVMHNIVTNHKLLKE